MSEYLNKVLIYLKQELPQPYKNSIIMVDNMLEIKLQDDINFTTAYNELFKSINLSVYRVRERKFDIQFNIKSKYQERAFTILK
jgi:hypothetical protein